METTFVPFCKYKKAFVACAFLTVILIAWQVGFLEKTKPYELNRLVIPHHLLKVKPRLVNTCNITQFPGHFMRKEDMQRVASTNWTFIYSAYYDVEKPDFVRLVGICQTTSLTYYCHLWYKEKYGGTKKMITSKATVIFNNNRRSEVALSCYILCPVVDRRSPFAVSVVAGNICSPVNNMVEVTYIGKTNYTRNFTMCLSPFYNINDADRLLEWIEFNRILGADNFLLYNYTGGQKLNNVIKHYVEIGLVEVFQWPLPRHGKRFFKRAFDDFSQVSAYNDCLFRSKATSKYIVITDFDEFIVPRVEESRTWLDMFRKLPQADAYTFRHCYFPIYNIPSKLEYPKKKIAKEYNIVSLLALKGQLEIWPLESRTKYITRTNTSYNLRTHSQMGARAYPVDPKVGLLHHYRRGYESIGPEKPVVIDKTVLDKYGDELASRVVESWSNIKK